MDKRKLISYWTCSDYAPHYHRTKLMAQICGRLQYWFYRFTGRNLFARVTK